MKNNKKHINTAKAEEKKSISRREALKKMGYAAFASSTMLLLLNNPTKVYAQSSDPENPGDPGGGWDWGDNKSSESSQESSYDEYGWD